LLLALGGLVLVMTVLSVCGLFAMSKGRRSKPARAATTEVPGVKSPTLGLGALEAFVDQHDSKSAARDTAPAWEAAAADFARANQSRKAPVRWRAGEQFARGRAAFHHGKLDDAEQRFQSAAELEPDWALPQLGLSEAYGRHGDSAKALASAQRAQQLDPKLWLGIRAGARAYLLKNDFTSAISELSRALQLAPKNALLLSDLALACHGAGNREEDAERYAKEALALDGDLVNAHVLLAERALESDKADDALAHANRAISVQSDNVSAWLAKGDALTLQKKRDDARIAYREALRLQEETKSTGAPKDRLAAVKRALSLGTLPEPRTHARSKPGRTVRPPPRSKPSPKPVTRSKSGGGAL
jgi:tetratricopeptide (TPR) repeat protein